MRPGQLTHRRPPPRDHPFTKLVTLLTTYPAASFDRHRTRVQCPEGGQFDRWWAVFRKLRTTSIERVGDGDVVLEVALDALDADEPGDGAAAGQWGGGGGPTGPAAKEAPPRGAGTGAGGGVAGYVRVPLANLEAYIRSLRFREKYAQIVSEHEFHAVRAMAAAGALPAKHTQTQFRRRVEKQQEQQEKEKGQA